MQSRNVDESVSEALKLLNEPSGSLPNENLIIKTFIFFFFLRFRLI